MIRLWGRTTSSNVMKVMWLLAELGLEHERIDAGLAFGGNDTPEFRARSPLGLIPMLEDGEFALFESNAILRYLCRAHAPGNDLYPASAREVGQVDAWLDFSQTALARPQSVLFQRVARTPPERRDQAAIAAAVAEVAKLWAVLDGRLRDRHHVACEAITIADMAFGPHVHRWFAMPFDRPDFAHLRAYYDRLATRPAFAGTCMGTPG